MEQKTPFFNPTFNHNNTHPQEVQSIHQLPPPPSNTRQPSENAPTNRKITKTGSEPKFRSYKEQILKIPKVKQILNKDKYIYFQDIEKRLQLIGTLKNQNYVQQQKCALNNLKKSVPSKSTTTLKSDKKSSKKNLKRHKTNFKIPLTRNNINQLNKVIVSHMGHNQRYKNQEVVFLKQYSQNAPFDVDKLSFMDQIDKVKIKYKQKFPELNEKVLNKNKLVLENVILNRNIRRQIKLDQKKQQKQHEKNVYRKIEQNSLKMGDPPQKAKLHD